MNIFYCGRVLWAGEQWLYDKHNGKHNPIEQQLHQRLPIYISQCSQGMLNVLAQLVNELEGELILEQAPSGMIHDTASAVLVGNRRCYGNLILSIRKNRWKLRNLAPDLEMVLVNLLKSNHTKPEVLLQPPQDFEHIVLQDSLENTMAQYPLVKEGNRSIGIALDDFYLEEQMTDYILEIGRAHV